MEKYRFIDDLTSDVMFEAYGKDLKEVFTNAAEALMSVICKIDKVKPEEENKIEVEGKNLEDLMFNWLQELIVAVDVEGMFFSRFEVAEIKPDGSCLKARVFGEPVKPELGETVVKAVTYYKYKFEKIKGGYRVRVSLDI
jgi:SHS2 domain-containing protein